MSIISIEIDDDLLCTGTMLTRLQTKREIVHRALELLVKSEERKGADLRYARWAARNYLS